MIELRRHAFASLVATALLLPAVPGAIAGDEPAAAGAADAKDAAGTAAPGAKVQAATAKADAPDAAGVAPAPPAAAAPAHRASSADAAAGRPAPLSREAAELRRSHGKTGRTFVKPEHRESDAPAGSGPPATPVPGDADSAAPVPPPAKAEIQNLGEGDQKISVVHHDGAWSVHAENVNTDNIARLWHQAGGPEITVKVPVDRPFTMSVHKLSPERIIERLYVGYSYTLHYDDEQHLVAARIYSPRESAAYKTPRLTETLGKWKELEADPASIPPGGSGDEPEPDAGHPVAEPPGAPAAEAPADEAPAE